MRFGGENMSTKHQRIIEYIESLPVGEKISVRTIAKSMQLSERHIEQLKRQKTWELFQQLNV